MNYYRYILEGSIRFRLVAVHRCLADSSIYGAFLIRLLIFEEARCAQGQTTKPLYRPDSCL